MRYNRNAFAFGYGFGMAQDAAADMKTFEVRIWEKAEHWVFDTTVEATDEQSARAKLKKEYPPSAYTVREVRQKH